MRIKTEGFVYTSRQNGVVINPVGVSPTIAVGHHSGVEPRIKVVYERDKLCEQRQKQR